MYYLKAEMINHRNHNHDIWMINEFILIIIWGNIIINIWFYSEAVQYHPPSMHQICFIFYSLFEEYEV